MMTIQVDDISYWKAEEKMIAMLANGDKDRVWHSSGKTIGPALPTELRKQYEIDLEKERIQKEKKRQEEWNKKIEEQRKEREHKKGEKLIGEGKLIEEVAEELGVSVVTVKRYLKEDK